MYAFFFFFFESIFMRFEVQRNVCVCVRYPCETHWHVVLSFTIVRSREWEEESDFLIRPARRIPGRDWRGKERGIAT
jgi:hypothetical protein